MLIEAAVFAPWCGLVDGSDPVVHRVNVDGLPMDKWETAEFATSVCGLAVKLVNLPWNDLRTRGTTRHRCSTCHPPRRRTA